MINFLSPEAKSAIRREYWVRVASVWCLLLSIVAITGVALFIPTYLLLTRQSDAVASEVVQAEDVEMTRIYTENRATLEKAQALAMQLSIAPPSPMASVVLHEIQATQTDAILLSGYSYTQKDAAVDAVEIQGVAATREALVQFASALERNPLFTRAFVPVSDLAEERDVSFTITITVAAPHT